MINKFSLSLHRILTKIKTRATFPDPSFLVNPALRRGRLELVGEAVGRMVYRREAGDDDED